MENVNVNSYFVSEKISKIRWIPEKHAQNQLKTFLTGSWDNKNVNSIKLFKLMKNEYSDSDQEYIPKVIDKCQHKGDVSAIELLTSEYFLVASTDGKCRLLQTREEWVKIRDTSDLLHQTRFGSGSPCTGLSIFDQNIATIGEDGRLNILAANPLKTIQQIEFTDNCSLMAVTYINHNEILASNRMGVLRIFDIRSHEPNNAPVTLMISCENENKANFATCLCYHPTQKHIVFAGSEEGSITIWDLRQTRYPASYLSAHASPITEINFDKINHNKLLTSSEDGELWQWNQLNFATDLALSITTGNINEAEINPWLNGERTKSKISVTSIISDIGKAVNTFDSNDSKIICGCDNEAIYYIDMF